MKLRKKKWPRQLSSITFSTHYYPNKVLHVGPKSKSNKQKKKYNRLRIRKKKSSHLLPLQIRSVCSLFFWVSCPTRAWRVAASIPRVTSPALFPPGAAHGRCWQSRDKSGAALSPGGQFQETMQINPAEWFCDRGGGGSGYRIGPGRREPLAEGRFFLRLLAVSPAQPEKGVSLLLF